MFLWKREPKLMGQEEMIRRITVLETENQAAKHRMEILETNLLEMRAKYRTKLAKMAEDEPGLPKGLNSLSPFG